MKSELSDSRQTKRKNAQKTTLENTKKGPREDFKIIHTQKQKMACAT